MKRLFTILFALLALGLGVVLATVNSHSATLNYLAGSLDLPLVVWLFAALAVGVALGLCVALVWASRLQRQVRRSERSRDLVQKELDNLRRLRSEVGQ
ncbi:MAG: LapA family protein [Pseudomonadota bacterium]